MLVPSKHSAGPELLDIERGLHGGGSRHLPPYTTSSSANHEEGHVAAHLLASQPHGTFVEAFSPVRDPIFWNMIENLPPLVDGQLVLPDRPGLG